ncbi:hypothetical protein [Paenibacillus sp. An7]|uniref:hypothetical protein n=1 Tax=Paenibacillus sp. An7 TaxID=2689577 RepID=UPI001F29BA74|nr:hypothetical protein [Paenibacillus sp. An7]
MNRIEKSQETYTKLFGDAVSAASATDPDLQDILSHLSLVKCSIKAIWMISNGS